MNGEAIGVLEEVQAAWNAAMADWDAAAVAKLYDPQAQLFGSLAPLFLGPAGAEQYFAAFATGESCHASFTNESVLAPTADLIVASGFVSFAMRVAGESRAADFRLTFVLRRTCGHWLILAHHASPIPTTSPAD